MTAYITPSLKVFSSDGEEILVSQFLRNSYTSTLLSSFIHQAVAGGSAIPVNGLTTLTSFFLQNNGSSSVTVAAEINSVTFTLTVDAGGMILLPSVDCSPSAPVITGTSECRVVITG